MASLITIDSHPSDQNSTLECKIGPSFSEFTTLIAGSSIVVLALVWCVALRPRLALLIVFLAAGLPSFHVPLPGHTIRPVELGLIVCLALIILLRFRMHMTLPHLLALLFCCITVISFIHVPEISTNATIFGANKRLYDLVVILLALFCGSFLVSSVPNMSSFLVAVLLSNIPLYIISLLQALGVRLSPLLMPDQNAALTGDGGRLVGPFDGAASFGIYLTGLLAMALSCWLLGSRQRDRLIGFIMVLATGAALIGSGTRSALIAMCVMLVVALIMTHHSKVLLVSILVVGIVMATFSTAIIAHFTHANTSTSNRLFLWAEAWKLIVAHPLLGIGLEQFHYYYERLIISQSTQLNQHGISVHNQYLEWAMESGIPALLSGIAFLVSILVLCSRAYQRARQEQRLALLATILAVIAVLVTGLLDVPLDDVEGGVFLCLLAGLAIGSLTQSARIRQYAHTT